MGNVQHNVPTINQPLSETFREPLDPTTKCTLAETKIGRLVYANGWSGGTVVTITLLFTFITILLTVRLPTHLGQTKSV
jgi:hypothetical protein